MKNLLNKIALIGFVIIYICLASCSVNKPNGLTYQYNKNTNQGLSSRINMNGYYITQRACDSSFFSAFTFYPDGLFAIATGSDLSAIEGCFFRDEKTTLCQNIAWGLYDIEGDTIKTQTLRQEGMAFCVIYRDYLIRNKAIINISDYVKPETTKIGYMKNYPSYRENGCIREATFKPSEKVKRNPSLCPYIKYKWFNNRSL